MEKWLTRVWYEEGAGSFVLLPLSVLYAAIMAVRSWAYKIGVLKTHRVAKPVIIVGNLTVGGTGKTPLVVWLSQRLAARGLKVAIVSRGYGSEGGAPREVSPKRANWRDVGDEPVLLSRRSGCRVFVSADRVAAARAAVENGADVVISDDGLQHLRLARDCEIVLIDGARGLGNQRILPAGPLRESAARLAGLPLVVTNGALSEQRQSLLRQLGQHSPVTMNLTPMRVLPVRKLEGQRAAAATSNAVPPASAPSLSAFPHDAPASWSHPLHGAPVSLADFRGRRVHAVAGIGNPARFFAMLRAHGIEVIEHAFPDHHPFAPNELIFGDDLPVLMTEKDAVRATLGATDDMYFVPVDAEFSEADAQRLLAGIDQALNASKRPTR